MDGLFQYLSVSFTFLWVPLFFVISCLGCCDILLFFLCRLFLAPICIPGPSYSFQNLLVWIFVHRKSAVLWIQNSVVLCLLFCVTYYGLLQIYTSHHHFGNLQVFLPQENDRYGLCLFCLFIYILQASQEMFYLWVSERSSHNYYVFPFYLWFPKIYWR